MLEKGMLRKVLGSSREEETGGWRKLHNKKLHDLQYFLIIMYVIALRRINWTGLVSHMTESRNS
jgi:hypothetical protein